MRFVLALLTSIGLLAFTAPGTVEAHDDPYTPTELGAVIATEVTAHNLEYPPITGGSEIQGFNAPEYAHNCRFTIRSTRHSAVGVCYNWSGSGSTKYQVAALMFDGCRSKYWAYGNVGWVFDPRVNSTAKWSYVYSPPGKWYITYAKIVAWKP